MKKVTHIIKLIILTLILIGGAHIIYGQGTPPAQSAVPEPLLVEDIDQIPTQTKDGNLSLGMLDVKGDATFYGELDVNVIYYSNPPASGGDTNISGNMEVWGDYKGLNDRQYIDFGIESGDVTTKGIVNIKGNFELLAGSDKITIHDLSGFTSNSTNGAQKSNVSIDVLIHPTNVDDCVCANQYGALGLCAQMNMPNYYCIYERP